MVRDSTTGIRHEKPRLRRQPELTATLRGSYLRLESSETAVLLDISGRRVMSLEPGLNDIRHVAPGVYFVRQKQTDRVTKVVVQR